MAVKPWTLLVLAACCVAHSSQEQSSMDVQKDIRKHLLNAPLGSWLIENNVLETSVTNSNAKDTESKIMDINKNQKKELLQNVQKSTGGNEPDINMDYDKESFKRTLQGRYIDSQRNSFNKITNEMDVDKKQERKSGEHDIDGVYNSDIAKNTKKRQLNGSLDRNSYENAEMNTDIKNNFRKQLLNIQRYEQESNSRSK